MMAGDIRFARTPVMTELQERVTRIISEEIAPALQLDGTSIEVLSVSDGIVQVRLGGVCGNCPSSIQMVIMEIEDELRRRVPEVEYLEALP
jgi:Fe-S cluster biogenesis protein NfuA